MKMTAFWDAALCSLVLYISYIIRRTIDTMDHSLLSSRLLSRNANVKICYIIILPIVLYGGEIWSH
jgi:hypothetical protein